MPFYLITVPLSLVVDHGALIASIRAELGICTIFSARYSLPLRPATA